jgi:hypothetical protein
MVEHYPWVPIGWRMGLGVAVMSYDGELCFSVTADRGVLADLDRLPEYISDAFDELEAVAGDVDHVSEPGVPAAFAATEKRRAPP